MQKVIDVLIKTKDSAGHVRHLGMADIEVDSIVINDNVIEARINKQKSKESAEAKKEVQKNNKAEQKAKTTTKKTTTKKTTTKKTK